MASQTNWSNAQTALVVAIVLGIVPAIVGIINIVQYFWPDIPQVEIRYSAQQIYLPVGYSEAIYNLTGENTVIDKYIETAEKNVPAAFTKYEFGRIGTALKKLSSNRIFGESKRVEFMRLIVENIGEKPAKKLKIVFPQSGYVEIFKSAERGESVQKYTSYVDIDDLHPDVPIQVYFWSTGFGTEKIRASFNDGRATITEEYVKRDPWNFVWKIPTYPIYAVLTMIGIPFFVWLIVSVFNAVFSSKSNTASTSRIPRRKRKKST